MKKIKLCILFLFLVSYSFIFAQVNKFTPYDELPSVDKIIKPEYSESMPDWGKMLYQYPVNYNDVCEKYRSWEIANPGNKNSLMRYFKLWRRHLETYVSADGTIHLPDMAIVNANLMASQSQSSQMKKAPAAGNTSNWTFWGPKETFWLYDGSTKTPPPAPWQANVYTFDVTEAFPDVLYAGTETGFISKSVDKGLTWEILGQKYAFGGGTSSIAIHPTNPDTVYVSAGNAIHRSLDGGLNWTRFSTAFQANHVKIDDSNPNKLIASTNNGVFISTNKASSWSKKTSTECWDIEFKPNSSDTIYALTRDANNKFRIIQSNNAGNNFSIIANFPDSLKNKDGGLLAVTPKNPNVLYAILLTSNMNNRPFVYKGTLSSGSWTWKLQHTGSDGGFTNDKLNNGQGYFDLVLEVSPVNENIVFAGTCTLHKSTNGGVRFTPVGGYAGSFAIHPDIQHMKMLSNGDTWVATDGGMNLTTDNFGLKSRWNPLVNGLMGSAMWGFDQGWNEDIIVGGRYHNGNTAMADFYNGKALRMGGGESPTGWIVLGKSRQAAFNDLGDGIILPETAESRTGGSFIFNKYPNMDGYGQLRGNVVTHPNYSGTIYVGSDSSMWVSENYAASYDLLYKFPGKIRYTNISTGNPSVMYADIVGNGFYRTADGGTTWKKTASTSAPGWTGEMAFAISPYDENVIYACKQHSSDSYAKNAAEIYRSVNGGTNWAQWSTLGKPIKSIVIQPTVEGKDLVYAVTSSNSFSSATVYYRKDGSASWTQFDTGYPSGMTVTAAAAFFRDSKLRVAGTGGVWESPLAETDFTPILVPWVDKRIYYAGMDSVQFDDHSWLDHQGVKWNWSITPAPAYISDANIRNPKAVFNTPGTYSVTMTVTKNDTEVYVKTMPEMFVVNSYPTIDCSNPQDIDKTYWQLIYVDSYEESNEATKAFDGNTSTIWHTAYKVVKNYPHEIQIDLRRPYNLTKMTYVPRTDGPNGRVKNYEIYVSNDKAIWGTAVKTGSLTNTDIPTTISFPETVGQYVRFRALSEVNGQAFASAAEISFFGCDVVTGIDQVISKHTVSAFPVPTNSIISVTLPFNDGIHPYNYSVYNSAGQQISSGLAQSSLKVLSIDVNSYPAGYYFVNLTDSKGVNYRAKFIKN